MPNSIIQTCVEVEKDGIDDLSGLGTVALMGLFALVNSKAPASRVYTTFSELLDLIGVEKGCSGARRFSPAEFRSIRLEIDHFFNVRYCLKEKKRDGVVQETWRPVFSEFGYEYMNAGRVIDPGNLPAGHKLVTHGAGSRSFFKVRKDSGKYLQPNRFFFELDERLISELLGNKGTFHFTVLPRKVFELLKNLGRTKILTRVVLLILRQTGCEFKRHLNRLLVNLGLDPWHWSKSVKRLESVLLKLQEHGVVQDFQLNTEDLVVEWNRSWLEEGAAA